ncbi:MAG TPA: hypothetical protein VNN10_01850 [Dehalococcoidia bacterium]|nr:hypothetical protein [Dehalococcoidia bacterium]
MRRQPFEQAHSNGERMLGALLLAAAGAAIVWSGLRFDSRYVTFLGAAMLAMVALGALISSFWHRWDDLSPGQRQLVDLPRRIVWAAARVLGGILELLIRLIGSFG